MIDFITDLPGDIVVALQTMPIWLFAAVFTIGAVMVSAGIVGIAVSRRKRRGPSANHPAARALLRAQSPEFDTGVATVLHRDHGDDLERLDAEFAAGLTYRGRADARRLARR